jgi:ubiquinone/menaquinone biosynthesis C-methylase UbiE
LGTDGTSAAEPVPDRGASALDRNEVVVQHGHDVGARQDDAELDVGAGTRVVDIACGSGLAAQTAGHRGASVAGIDASEALVDIARVRTPEGDFRVGNMFALPFPDASFDVATSFNGIWKGCEGALHEVRRVLVPTGRLGLTFWGPPKHLGLLPYFLTVIELSPPSHGEASLEQGDTGRDGIVQEMLGAAGFRPGRAGVQTVVNEWPDLEVAVRALAAAGPSVPAIAAVGTTPSARHSARPSRRSTSPGSVCA